jgi:hypothetical protein
MIKTYLAMAAMAMEVFGYGRGIKDLKFSDKGDWYKRYTTHKHSVKRSKKRKK